MRIRPQKFHAIELDTRALRETLKRAAKEGPGVTVLQGDEISLPMPDGTLARFRFVESPVMEPELAVKFPEIKTYLGQGIDDRAACVRFDITPAGFHAQILSPDGAVYIDPAFAGDTKTHLSYYKRDFRRGGEGFSCVIPNENEEVRVAAADNIALRSGGNLRTYRVACAATGEYTQYHGGTVSSGMAAIVTAINRVTGIYEAELAIRLVLVNNNNLLVYTNGNSDPYSNSDGSRMLGQNQSNIDSVIGSANYDIGHVFSTGGGGIAYLRSVCVEGNKARGVTGLANPVGDPFYVDYVAHEMGHQFGGNHTFNSVTGSCGGGNRNAATAYEPGSGSTIQAYAGICGADDLQSFSNPYFHSISFDEMDSFVSAGSGSSCPTVTATGNAAPIVNAGPNYTIPRSTPFTLTATGSDPDGDTLTYCWEERDLGAATTLTDPDNGSSPLFRSFNPMTSPSRTFPKLSSILNNASSLGEKLPTTTRTMNFRVTARDNRVGGGGVNTSDTQISVVSTAGPFVVTAPNTNVVWSGVRTVTWNVAGTTAAPINAAGVNIYLSTNGGLTFPIVLKSNTPNDGSEAVLLPNLFSSAARIKVEGAGNIFFDVSDANFTIAPIAISSATVSAESCSPGNSAIDPGETVTIQVSLANIGAVNTTNISATLIANPAVSSPTGPQHYGVLPSDGTPVARPFTFTAVGSCGSTINATFEIRDGTALLGNITRTFTLGNVTIQTFSATNSAEIKVPGSGAQGPGAPYPSTVSFSGIQGSVTKVVATLQNFGHTGPVDVDVLLVAPNGASVLLMSDTGGGANANNVTLTFDDAAASLLPSSSALMTGTYKPSNHSFAPDDFAAPAPAGGYGSELATLNGINPNGTWSLYAMDNGINGKGSIATGWRLSVTAAIQNCCSAGNTAPMISDIPNQVADEDSSILLSFSVGDAESPPGSLTVSASSSNTNLVPNMNLSFSGSSSQRELAIFPSADQFGNTTITVTVGDGVLSTSDTFLLNINAINDAPVLAAISDVTVAEGGFLRFTNSATDIDTPLNQLTFSLDPNAPTGATIDETTGVFSWSPSEQQGPGAYQIAIEVNDHGSPSLTHSQSFLVTVNEVNSTPILSAIMHRTVHAGGLVLFTNAASDPDLPANALYFSLDSGAPAGSSVGMSNGVFSWATSEANIGTNIITLRVTDDGSPNLGASDTFSVIVVPRPLQSVVPAGTDLKLMWTAVPGQNYDVQFSTNLILSGWTTLTNVTASEDLLQITNRMDDEQKFYRILVP